MRPRGSMWSARREPVWVGEVGGGPWRSSLCAGWTLGSLEPRWIKIYRTLLRLSMGVSKFLKHRLVWEKSVVPFPLCRVRLHRPGEECKPQSKTLPNLKSDYIIRIRRQFHQRVFRGIPVCGRSGIIVVGGQGQAKRGKKLVDWSAILKFMYGANSTDSC